MSDTIGQKLGTGTQAKVQDTPLTIREHLDPDKHWIGETLAPPTQTEIAATVGSTSGPGDSPFVARADHLHKLGAGVVTPTNIASGVFTGVSPRAAPGVTLVDDQAAYIGFGIGIQYGIFVIAANTAAYSTIGWFRSGDGGGNCIVLAAATPATTTGSGGQNLTGTTGTDGHLNIRARNFDTTARLYIENRTAASRAFVITFLSLVSPTLVPDATWTII